MAIADSYAKDNPVKQVKFFSGKDALRERILTQDEEKRLLAECAGHLKPVVMTAIHAGMRVGEILSLKWKHVNLQLTEKLSSLEKLGSILLFALYVLFVLLDANR